MAYRAATPAAAAAAAAPTPAPATTTATITAATTKTKDEVLVSSLTGWLLEQQRAMSTSRMDLIGHFYSLRH